MRGGKISIFGIKPNIDKMEIKRDLKGLIKALSYKGSDQSVRVHAANALGRLCDPKAIEPLVRVLQNEREDSSVRVAVAEALGNIGNIECVEPLIQTLCKPSATCNSFWDTCKNCKGRKSYSLLSHRNICGDYVVRDACIKSIKKLGKMAAEPLIKTLNNVDNRFFTLVVEALAKISRKTAKEALIKILDNAAAYNRVEAAGALGNFRGKAVASSLAKALNDHNLSVVCSAIEALGRSAGSTALNQILSCLSNEEYTIRIEAAKTLAAIGDSRAIIPIAEAIDDLRGAEPPENSDFLGGPDIYYKARMWEAFRTISDAGQDDFAIDSFVKCLNSSSDNVRSFAAQRLGEVGDVRAVEPLIQIFKERKALSAVIIALGRIGDVRAVEPLTQFIKNEGYTPNDPGNIVYGYARDALKEILESNGECLDDCTREAAIKALKKYTEVDQSKIQKAPKYFFYDRSSIIHFCPVCMTSVVTDSHGKCVKCGSLTVF